MLHFLSKGFGDAAQQQYIAASLLVREFVELCTLLLEIIILRVVHDGRNVLRGYWRGARSTCRDLLQGIIRLQLMANISLPSWRRPLRPHRWSRT